MVANYTSLHIKPELVFVIALVNTMGIAMCLDLGAVGIRNAFFTK